MSDPIDARRKPKWLTNAESRASEEETAYRTIRRVRTRLEQEADRAAFHPGGDNPAAWECVADELYRLAAMLEGQMDVLRRALTEPLRSVGTHRPARPLPRRVRDSEPRAWMVEQADGAVLGIHNNPEDADRHLSLAAPGSRVVPLVPGGAE